MTYIILLSAVLIGGLIAEFANLNDRVKKLFATFSGAFLLAVTVFHLLPEVFNHSSKDVGFFIMLGVFIQISLEFVSKGIEHAHDASSHGHFHKFSMAIFISLSIHAFLEGAPLAHAGHDHAHDHIHYFDQLSNPILAGIFIHKVPIAAILYTMLRESNYSKLKSSLFLIVFASMSPLGSYLTHELHILAEYSNQINAIVIGIFLHISTVILFESDKGHHFNSAKLAMITLATAIVYFSY